MLGSKLANIYHQVWDLVNLFFFLFLQESVME